MYYDDYLYYDNISKEDEGLEIKRLSKRIYIIEDIISRSYEKAILSKKVSIKEIVKNI